MNDTNIDTNILAALIQKKHECLGQLCALGRQQKELIDAADMTSLLDVLAVKQRVLLELQRMEQLTTPYRNQTPEERQWSSPELRERCARQLQECEQLFQEIVRQEQESEQELIQRRDEAARQIECFQQTRQVSVAYTSLPSESVSLDLSSD